MENAQLAVDGDQLAEGDLESLLPPRSARSASYVDTLRERIRLLEAVVENFPGGISLFDSDLQMVLCNQQQKMLLDYPEDRSEGFPTSKDCSASTPCAANTARAMSKSRSPGACGWCTSESRMSTSGPGRTVPSSKSGACRSTAAASLPPTRRHRAAPQPGDDRPYGASRHADRPAQPDAFHRSAADGDRACQTVRPGRAALSQHRQVQAVNEKLGHKAGDALLIAIAERLAQSGARERYGGAAGRRRIRHRPDGHSRTGRCSGTGAPRAERAFRARSESWRSSRRSASPLALPSAEGRQSPRTRC